MKLNRLLAGAFVAAALLGGCAAGDKCADEGEKSGSCCKDGEGAEKSGSCCQEGAKTGEAGTSESKPGTAK